MHCPLCSCENTSSLEENPDFKLRKCENCFLVYKDSTLFLSDVDEKERYVNHENSIDNNGYVEHLNKAIYPFLKYAEFDSSGLDYGCGPQPVLSEILKEKKIRCDVYDPFFFDDFPGERKDFIFSTEVFEHFHNPQVEMRVITSLLMPGGLLTVMTNMWNDDTNFNNWWYLNDPTHVIFFNPKTFEFISKEYGYDILENDENEVVVMRKHWVKE